MMNYVYIASCPFCHAPIFKDISKRSVWSWLFPGIKRTCACMDILRAQIETSITFNMSGVVPLSALLLSREVVRRDE